MEKTYITEMGTLATIASVFEVLQQTVMTTPIIPEPWAMLLAGAFAFTVVILRVVQKVNDRNKEG